MQRVGLALLEQNIIMPLLNIINLCPIKSTFDTTLRDGEQCPGASMNLREKLEVARQMERLGMDVIEAGFPCISDGDFEAVHTIAREIKMPHRWSGPLRKGGH